MTKLSIVTAVYNAQRTIGDTMDSVAAQDAEVFILRNGRTVRAVVHTDTALMERIYGKKHATAN